LKIWRKRLEVEDPPSFWRTGSRETGKLKEPEAGDATGVGSGFFLRNTLEEKGGNPYYIPIWALR